MIIPVLENKDLVVLCATSKHKNVHFVAHATLLVTLQLTLHLNMSFQIPWSLEQQQSHMLSENLMNFASF